MKVLAPNFLLYIDTRLQRVLVEILYKMELPMLNEITPCISM